LSYQQENGILNNQVEKVINNLHRFKVLSPHPLWQSTEEKHCRTESRCLGEKVHHEKLSGWWAVARDENAKRNAELSCENLSAAQVWATVYFGDLLISSLIFSAVI